MPLTLNDIDLPPNVEGKLSRGVFFVYVCGDINLMFSVWC